jgi:hypothetical protein
MPCSEHQLCHDRMLSQHQLHSSMVPVMRKKEGSTKIGKEKKRQTEIEQK